jgi:N-acetylmuramoyl-L-alanine amidase
MHSHRLIFRRNGSRPSGARCGVSAILFAVRNLLRVLAFAAGVSAFLVSQAVGRPASRQETPPAEPAPQQVPEPQAPSPSPAPSGPLVVLDPAHGGTDTGARGEGGMVEKDIVLQVARAVRAELEGQGIRVVMTRNDDSNPSYDDRAAVANAYRDAIFISLHVSSTGTVGSARTYYDQLDTPIPPAVVSASAKPQSQSPQTGGLTVWEDAQRPYAGASHHLADLVQIELAEHFQGSPDTSAGAAVRALRSVAAPAVAIELSSVAAPDLDSLTSAAAPLAGAIERAITAFRAGASGAR